MTEKIIRKKMGYDAASIGVLTLARETASMHYHAETNTTHLLCGVIWNETLARHLLEHALRKHGASLTEIWGDLESIWDEEATTQIQEDPNLIRYSSDAEKTLELAAENAALQGFTEVKVDHILVAILRRRGPASRILKGLGVRKKFILTTTTCIHSF